MTSPVDTTLILVDQIQTDRRNGLSNYDAIVESTVRRARPVILTAVAAMLAFIPPTQSTFWGALAYVLIGGVGVGTLLTLLFLPALYAIWFRVKKDRGAEPIPETALMSEFGSQRGLFPSRIHADQPVRLKPRFGARNSRPRVGAGPTRSEVHLMRAVLMNGGRVVQRTAFALAIVAVAVSPLAIVAVAVSPLEAAEQHSIALATPMANTGNSAVQAIREPSTPSHVYVEVIVKACPEVETPLEPTSQGHSYDDDKPMTLDERSTYYVKLGCIDVPIPAEWMTQEMTYDGCKGHAGYLAALQFLQQRQDLKAFPTVGYWVCVPHKYPVAGVAGT